MNFFEELADQQIVSPVKSRMKAVETRREKMLRARADAEKKLEEKDLLLRLYKRGKRAELKTLMSGTCGKEVRGLISFMKSMSLSSAPALVRVIEGAVWIRDLSDADRSLVEGLVFNGIVRLREKNGLSFWEDAMPDEPPKAFDDIQAIIRSEAASC